MTAPFAMGSLRPEQGPPLAIPASFFLLAPLAMIGAGTLLALEGSSLLWTRFGGATAALTHLGTLGVIGSVTLGALYQMIPVLCGSPVPMPRLAHGVHAGFALGLSLFVAGLVRETRLLVVVGATLLFVSLSAFLVPVAIALLRAPARNATVRGMRVAVAGLALVVVLGVALGHTRSSGTPNPHYSDFLRAHLSVALVVFLGGLISAVSFQVIPMFYLAPPYPKWAEGALTTAFGASLLGVVAALLLGGGATTLALAIAPGALAAWLAHPLLTLSRIQARRRKRRDPSLAFWRAGLVAGVGALPLLALAERAADLRFPVAFGFAALWGWAALIVHGMLGRIVPFLVWFHVYSHDVGKKPVPSMRALLPERQQWVGFSLHVTGLVSGLAAIATGRDLLARGAGVAIALTGVVLGRGLAGVLAHTRNRAAG